MELALQANDGTTSVTIPDQSEFIDAAIELSITLRQAKVEAPLRPKVIGALVAAIHEGKVLIDPKKSLASVNDLLRKAINETNDLPQKKKKQLIDALELSGADFNRLAPFIGRIVTILNRLNVKAVLQTDTDFLGMFYEAFLRYGYDNNALGIVFTPRHITRFCVRLTSIDPSHKVIDIASGTGGFLVAAFDAMNHLAASAAQRETIRESLAGFDTNPTIWALASLNMYFRGDGKSHIENASCFEPNNKKDRQKTI
ncbi:N-6 DNA methylase [mine drainage metagenome]|uniref:site-specific DNA-methyltransferase (adenine-specific) n=1 Tax=mine drainage metagenome TaxID=410659 RepID=T1BJ71_9ZZZZ